MLKQLIVNADDFGYTPGVTSGILAAHVKGIVTSTSVMVNMPHAAQSIQRAKNEAPQLGLGLHLTLTAGRPLLDPVQIPTLVGTSGTFKTRAELVPNLHSVDVGEVEAELRAQIAAFSRMAGHPPDHLDSHHHITYLTPPLLALTMKIAGELGVPIRRPVPGDVEKSASMLTDLGIAVNADMAWELSNTLVKMTETAQVRMPDRLIVDFYGQHVILGDLLNLLMELDEGVAEIMCHPAEVDPLLEEQSSYSAQRAKELETLIHPSAREVCNAQFIQLINFSDLR